jgi:hypothetical protein
LVSRAPVSKDGIEFHGFSANFRDGREVGSIEGPIDELESEGLINPTLVFHPERLYDSLPRLPTVLVDVTLAYMFGDLKDFRDPSLITVRQLLSDKFDLFVDEVWASDLQESGPDE